MTLASTTRPRDLDAVTTTEGMRLAVEELGDTPSECLICASASVEEYFQKQGKRFWICKSCEFVFVHDIYPEFAETFDADGYSGIVANRDGLKPKKLRELDGVVKQLDPFRKCGRILEVGCGEGHFLDAASRAGWDVQGLEIVPGVAAVARERYELNVLESTLSDADLEPGSFDVVYSNEVIEHVVDPVELMQQARRVLRPGGIAIVRTGNARSWSAKIRGGSWWYYYFCGHGHIRFFSPSAAQALAKATGFASVECESHGFAFAESDELRGKWFKVPAKLAQAPLSTLAGTFGAGHRLSMRFLAE